MIPKADIDTLKPTRYILLRVVTHGHDLLETIEQMNPDELAARRPLRQAPAVPRRHRSCK